MRRDDNIKNHSDAGLIERFQQTRDNEIIGELFQRYTHLVFGVCMKYLKDEDEAKDAVMHIFEKFLTGLHRHNVDNLKAWLYGVAKNHCLMYFRSKKVHIELPIDLSNDNAEDDSALYDEKWASGEMAVELTTHLHLNGEQDKEQQLVLMEEAIKKLNEQQKICIELFYLQEKSYEDVSQITGYTTKEVKSYIQNGKRNLKIIMMSYYEKQGG